LRISCSFVIAATVAIAALAAACQREPLPEGPPQAVRLEAAPAEGDVATLVKARAQAVSQAGGHLLVYVGATWCGPCREFHEAAARGELDRRFPGLVLLEFDADRDHDRLIAAGYGSRLVPLFARPGDDGRSSGQYTEGVRKGAVAVDDLEPRLRDLLR
jgi:hypothetical protein